MSSEKTLSQLPLLLLSFLSFSLQRQRSSPSTGAAPNMHFFRSLHRRAWRRRHLAFNSTLRSLNLALNALSLRSISALSDALGLDVNRSLTALDVSSNHLTDACCWSLCDALASNSSLRFLSVAANFIGPDGAHALAKAALLNTAIEDIVCHTNRMGDAGEETVALALINEERATEPPAMSESEQAAMHIRRERMRGKIRAEQEKLRTEAEKKRQPKASARIDCFPSEDMTHKCIRI